MNFLEEIKNLEKQGVFIEFSNEHYKDGSNCNFSIRIIEVGKTKYGTSWYGDNHEFGDVHEAMEGAVKMAKWLAEDKDRMYDYFTWSNETVTQEGIDRRDIQQKTSQALMNYMYENHAPYKKSCDDGKKFMEEYEKNN